MENYNITKQQLIDAPLPEETRTYKPVTHGQLMELTEKALEASGFIIENESFSSARGGMVANAKYTIANLKDEEMQLQIAWQNSYNKSLSLKFAIGAKVFICGNGSVSGDMGSFKKKHQGSVQEFTPAAIAEYIQRAGDVFKRMQYEREEMKKIILLDQTIASIIGKAFILEEFISSTELNIIARELKRPTYNYGAPSTLWELYQFFTYAMKEVHPSLWMENHVKAHNFFVKEARIIDINAEIVVPEPKSHPQLGLFDANYTELTDGNGE